MASQQRSKVSLLHVGYFFIHISHGLQTNNTSLKPINV